MDLDQVNLIRQQKVIDELKAELTYWKESSEYYKDRCCKLERYNSYLRNKLNKTLDK